MVSRSTVLVPGFFALMAAPSGLALAATLTVGPGQTYATIGAAITASVNGDIVQVEPGTYQENVSFGGKAITVQSTSGAQATVIHGGGSGATVTFNGGETSTSILVGFTITGGGASGVSVFVNSAPVIRDCVITGNLGDNGGGMNLWGAATVTGNAFIDNQATQGGGLYLNHTGAKVERNTFLSNDAASGGGVYVNAGAITSATIEGNVVSGYGGGIYAKAGASITNAVIADNTATYGGGVHVSTGTSTRLTNVTVADNTAQGTFGSGGGIHVASGAGASLRNVIVAFNGAAIGGGIYSDGSNPGQSYGDVFGNVPSDFGGNAVSPAGANGNISADPTFSSTYPYALKSGSPCINTGDPNRSYEDPDGSQGDMGAYGGPAANFAAYVDGDADGVSLANEDCDDTDAGNFPGNIELCDGLDNDCDGEIDNGLNSDDDGDGITECQGDCDDFNGGVFPGQTEIPDDDVDQDCDGQDATEGGCNQSHSTGAAGLALAALGLMVIGTTRRRR